MSRTTSVKIIAALALIVGGALYLGTRGERSGSQTARNELSGLESGQARGSESNDQVAHDKNATSNQNPRPADQAKAGFPGGNSSEKRLDDSSRKQDGPRSAYEKELNEYTRIKAKVFLSEEEKEYRRRLLADRSMLEDLGRYLRTPAQTGATEDEAQKSAALDLLFEAFDTKSEVSEAILRDIVQDKQIENESLDLQTRKSLAGVKAEVLYEWSSRQPAQSETLRSWLPGPVSEKIWKNVQATQQQNVAESMMEARSQAAGH